MNVVSLIYSLLNLLFPFLNPVLTITLESHMTFRKYIYFAEEENSSCSCEGGKVKKTAPRMGIGGTVHSFITSEATSTHPHLPPLPVPLGSATDNRVLHQESWEKHRTGAHEEHPHAQAATGVEA